MQFMGAGSWKGQPLEKCLVLMQMYLDLEVLHHPQEDQGRGRPGNTGLTCHTISHQPEMPP